MNEKTGLLRDERGSWSMARVLLGLEVIYVWWLGWKDTVDQTWEVPGPVWALHASLIIALVAWAAGPRGLQYLGPQVAGAGRAAAAAIKTRLQGTDRFREDDERDP